MNKGSYVTLKLSKKEFEYLRECMMIFESAFAINEEMAESCMAILLELSKKEKKDMKMFVNEMLKWSTQVRHEKKRLRNDDIEPYGF